MKNLIFTCFALFLASGVLFSQEDPEKALAKAGRALSSYNLDPANNTGKLAEAVQMIDIAVAGDATKGKLKTWQTRGEIYNALADKDITAIALAPQGGAAPMPERPEAAFVAAEAFVKALALAEKKYETKDALKGMTESANKLNVIGNNQIQRNDYAGASKSLDMVMTLNDLMLKNGEPAIIPPADMDNHKYVVAYTAQSSGNKARARELFKNLYDQGTNEATVYASYFNLLTEEKDPDAIKVLEAGRAKFPDNTEILFAEINYYIQQQRYDILETKLKEAIAKEPNNPSVYSALGNVYMNLFTKEYAAAPDSETAKKYFQSALDYFGQAIALDAKQFDAIYSIGSLYFNKAVELTKAANNLPMTKEGQAKYKVMEAEMTNLMNTALPYFQKTESLDPDDENTLIALAEIYARMNDFDKSKEFKARLQTVRDGGKNSASYFKQ